MLPMEEMHKCLLKIKTYGQQLSEEEYKKLDEETAVIPPPCKGKYQPKLQKHKENQ